MDAMKYNEIVDAGLDTGDEILEFLISKFSEKSADTVNIIHISLAAAMAKNILALHRGGVPIQKSCESLNRIIKDVIQWIQEDERKDD